MKPILRSITARIATYATTANPQKAFSVRHVAIMAPHLLRLVNT